MSKNKSIGYELNQSPFYSLKSRKDLARLLFISERNLKLLTRSKNLYLEHDQESNTGKIRHIEKPKTKLKSVQKRVRVLLSKIRIPDYIHAPGKSRSYITNAIPHKNASVIRRIDISKYFSSTRSVNVYRFFNQTMLCSPDVAGILTRLLTFNDHLPTGSPSSPILSYFTHINMWSKIYEIVEAGNCNLTVYMDDVTVSGNQVPSRLIWEIKQQFHKFSLRSNDKKEKYYVNKQSCEITGVIIHNRNKLIAPNRQHLKIRQIDQELLLCKDNLEKQQELGLKREGLQSQIRQIDGANNSTGSTV